MQIYLQDFGAALPAQRAQDQAPRLGQSSLVDSFQPQSAHGVVVVVLPGEHFTVRVVSVRKHGPVSFSTIFNPIVILTFSSNFDQTSAQKYVKIIY